MLHGQTLAGTQPHYLVFEYSPNTIQVYKPRGVDTSLTIPLPASWVGVNSIQLKAVATDGTEYKQPLSLLAGNLVFTYLNTINSQTIDHFVISYCPADIVPVGGDGIVNISELLMVVGLWGACPIKGSCIADMNGDNIVNITDMLMILGAWGGCP